LNISASLVDLLVSPREGHREEARVDNKDQAAWEEYRKTLDNPAEMYVGWQNKKGTQFTLCSAKNEQPPRASSR